MKRRYSIVLFCISALALFFLFASLIHGHTLAVLDPKGIVALQERNLMVAVVLLALFIVVPVFALLLGIGWKFRADNIKADYAPEWDHNSVAESVWWGIPCIIILILAVMTWNSSQQLDPSKALASGNQPMTIQVVALQWKWLFIYPDQHIATVNDLEFPENTPVHFVITSDAPMNSFWIPQLGSQIYAMPGMSTGLNLMADHLGTFQGVSANLSGEGFAGMHFAATSLSEADFKTWTESMRTSSTDLDQSVYTELAKPSQNTPISHYSIKDTGLYDGIMMKYMMPTTAQ